MKHGHPWRGFGPAPRERPPWWPAEEPWPPGPERIRRWRMSGRRFLWRAAAGFLLFWMLAGATCAGTVWLIERLTGTEGVSPWLVAIPLAVVLFLGFGFARAMRGFAFPFRDLIEAAQQVEAGDLSPRVRERGPRELRALARAFNAMLGRLESAETQRRRLLADVTHELRTPVAVLQGNLEALLDGVYPADPEHLAPLLEETQVLSRLIDDLRTLSLAESGALDLHREATDLGILVGEVLASFRIEAEAKPVALRSEVPDDLPLVEVDPLRLREVLVNLVGNALRYTPAGGEVSLEASLDHGQLRIDVADTGEGIPADDLPHVFERFYKSAESSGSGLGLAIARNLVLAHGGRIDARSAPGEGTTMSLTIPASAGPAD